MLKQGTLGITSFAAGALGDIIHCEMPSVGSDFAKGEVVVGIESVKTAADVYMPVKKAEVTEANPALEDPEVLSNDPEGEGWLVKVTVSDDTGFSKLLNREDYD